VGGGGDGTAGAIRPAGRAGTAGEAADRENLATGPVTYEAEVVCHNGSLYQALKDTGQVPGGSHWICLAVAGRDAITPQVRGTFDQSVSYRRLDVVALNGGSFIALKDAPGPCPGPGWQLIASQGRRGAAGEKGDRGLAGPRGDAGASGATIVGWKIDRERYVAIPLMSDGREGPPLELHGLFEQFHEETR
jgi:hypothetical protein